ERRGAAPLARRERRPAGRRPDARRRLSPGGAGRGKRARARHPARRPQRHHGRTDRAGARGMIRTLSFAALLAIFCTGAAARSAGDETAAARPLAAAATSAPAAAPTSASADRRILVM